MRDVAEALADFWSIQGDFIYRHHNDHRFQLHVPKEETFPIPLKKIDETRSTHTDLDVMQEKRIDDYWNVDLNRVYTTQIMCGPKYGPKFGKAAQNREEQEWAIENPN